MAEKPTKIWMVEAYDAKGKPCDYEIVELLGPHVWCHTNLGSGDMIRAASDIGDGYHTKVENRDEVYTHLLAPLGSGGMIDFFQSYEACMHFITVQMRRTGVKVLEYHENDTRGMIHA